MQFFWRNRKMSQRRRYDRDFKRNAVLLTQEPGRTVSDVAENLGVKKDILYRWRREYLNSGGKENFPGNGRESLPPEKNE